ncbi:hypothetical protein CANARDRAFT_29071 [[Candida] arabinofermentans NRRL YB-2248]|uniref:Phosphoglycerate mutase n=1 Tax=[Candida] arabinofermentans NRRL YB-2248 TaxID=983967 RepID=A0A1E4SYH6_9ASCO|nr:hypothetical protein CANARDRAFT_29071 [[Candida] arabinofermentans NRRL YB-2248]
MTTRLIKLTNHDVKDSLEHPEQDAVYKSLIAEKQLEIDPKTGEYYRPWRFEVQDGFFKQSDINTDDLHFDFIDESFGLKLNSWDELIEKLKDLNSNCSENECYKLLFCARHGQGYHNLAVEILGSEAWDAHWSKIEGTTLDNGEKIVWGPDPFLTKLGEDQAKELNKAWIKQIENGCPVPTRFFSSPFTRSMTTLIGTWNGIVIQEDGADPKTLLKPPRQQVIIKEDLRETIGEHLCDKRSSKKIIEERASKYGFIFEDGFEDEDVLYKDDWRESVSEHSLRANSFLQDLFEGFPNDIFVNCTSHSGTIRALITALSHRKFAIPTAGTIPIVIKGTRVKPETIIA